MHLYNLRLIVLNALEFLIVLQVLKWRYSLLILPRLCQRLLC